MAHVTPYINKFGSIQNLVDEIGVRDDLTAKHIYTIAIALPKHKMLKLDNFFINFLPSAVKQYNGLNQKQLDVVRNWFFSHNQVVPFAAEESFESYQEKVAV